MLPKLFFLTLFYYVIQVCHHVKAKCGFRGPIRAAGRRRGERLHPCSNFASILIDLLAPHREMQVPQHKVAYVSTLHQQICGPRLRDAESYCFGPTQIFPALSFDVNSRCLHRCGLVAITQGSLLSFGYYRMNCCFSLLCKREGGNTVSPRGPKQ